MKYVVMNTNAIDGVLKGSFEKIDNLYLKRVDPDPMMRGHWTSYLIEAMSFETEQDAWDCARDVYGIDYTSKYMVVLSVSTEGLHNSVAVRDRVLAKEVKSE